MSTYFYFRNPQSRQDLESIGVLFHDGEMELRDGTKKPHTWIVNKKPPVQGETNWLHPNFMEDGMIYGFTRYAGNTSVLLTDILEDNMIEYCDEYEVSEAPIPTNYIIKKLGMEDIDDPEELLDEAIQGVWFEEADTFEYFWSEDKRKMVDEFVTEQKDRIIQEYNDLVVHNS